LKIIGIIGLGSIGKRHLGIIKESRPDLKIVIVTSSKSKTRLFSQNNIVFVNSIKNAIEQKIDAAIICSPSPYHLLQAKKLADSGIHVLVEKPLSNKLKDIKNVLKFDQNKKIINLLGYCLRYDPLAIKLKNIIKSNKYGKIKHVQVVCESFLPNWRPDQDYRESVSAQKKLGGGVLLELSHELDYVCWIFDSMFSVSAILENNRKLKIDVEESASLKLLSNNGYKINIYLDFASNNLRRFCKVSFESGQLIWDILAKELSWINLDKSKEIKYKHKFDRNYVYKQQLKHFFNCIENHHSPKINFKDGINVLTLIEAAIKSNSTGEKVILK
jgi:predicted dehydrogenase